ncbi:hypothetical protein RESH_05449 [Rhodopirellula europaea SH398]|uniref:Uncharacterized protein n=1 Tax=Rhodopirellula europaea SH398 TaxID=1263868 RepID=M5RXB3_9BACT|nr:hypothetical protein RESH_05449 [Rhodopirellula europaea SH398]
MKENDRNMVGSFLWRWWEAAAGQLSYLKRSGQLLEGNDPVNIVLVPSPSRLPSPRRENSL